MSLYGLGLRFGEASFPRVSGDEPLLMGERALAAAFSPRERG